MKRVSANWFHLLQALFWCANCTLATYAVAYFLHQDFSSVLVSGLVAVGMIAAFLGQMFWGRCCDRNNGNREIFLMNCLLSAALTVVLCIGLQRGARWPLLLYPILIFLNGPLSTNLDAWESKALADKGASLGLSRGCAAAAYASFHFFYAKGVEASAYRLIPWFSCLLYAMTIILAWRLPSVRGSVQNTAKVQTGRHGFKDLLRDHAYLVLLFLIFLIGMGSSPITNMKIVLYQSVGKDVSFLGVDSLVCSGLQIPLFFLAAAWRKYSAEKRLLISMGMLMGAVVMLSYASSAAMVLIGHAILSAAYPILLMAMRNIVTDTVEDDLQTTANGLCDAMYGSVSGIFAMTYTGIVLENAGVHPLMRISMGLYMIAAGICIMRFLRRNKKSGLKPSCERIMSNDF